MLSQNDGLSGENAIKVNHNEIHQLENVQV